MTLTSSHLIEKNINKPLNSPWNNSALKRIRRSKDRAWNYFRENPTTGNLNYAKFMDKSYSDKEFRLKLDYEQNLTNNLKDNCKGLYSYLKVHDAFFSNF